jgi:hypothetical protein
MDTARKIRFVDAQATGNGDGNSPENAYSTMEQASKEASTTDKVKNPLESRFGYHCCDRTTYLKMKRLHKAFWKNVRIQAAQERWDAKQPQNRNGNRPLYCPLFKVEKVLVYKNLENGSTKGTWTRFTEGNAIRKVYLLAKKRSTEPVTPFSPDQLIKIEDWISILDKWEAKTPEST